MQKAAMIVALNSRTAAPATSSTGAKPERDSAIAADAMRALLGVTGDGVMRKLSPNSDSIAGLIATVRIERDVYVELVGHRRHVLGHPKI